MKSSIDEKVVNIQARQPGYEVRGPRGNIKITPDGVFLGPDFLSTLPNEILSRIVEDNRSDELMRHLLKMVKQNPSKALQGFVEPKD